MGEPRRYLPVRISDKGYQRLKQRADATTSGNVSELVRRLLKYGVERMPDDFH